MSYEFTKFYPAVCKRLGVDPSEASEALYWAVLREFDRLSDQGVLSGSFVSSVQEAVDAISADEQFVTRIDRIEDAMPLDEYYVQRIEQNAEGYRQMMLREYIPVMLATEFLGVTRPTIIKLIREGKLRTIEQPVTMVSTTDLARLHEQREQSLRELVEEWIMEE